jgi:hypothetical protein
MTHHSSELPPWLALIDHPGVIEVLACLHNHGPTGHAALCAYVEPGRSDTSTTPAVRKLATYGLLRISNASGSLDEPTSNVSYELTYGGHQLALALTAMNEAFDRHHHPRRRSRDAD